MTMTETFGEVIYAYTAEQAVADGVSVQFAPATAQEAGFHIPVVLTRAAFSEAIQWDRPDGKGWQSEDARFWDVLSTGRRAAQEALKTGEAYAFKVLRVANKTKSGAYSRSQTPSMLTLAVRAEGFNLAGEPCIIISLPNED